MHEKVVSVEKVSHIFAWPVRPDLPRVEIVMRVIISQLRFTDALHRDFGLSAERERLTIQHSIIMRPIQEAKGYKRKAWRKQFLPLYLQNFILQISVNCLNVFSGYHHQRMFFSSLPIFWIFVSFTWCCHVVVGGQPQLSVLMLGDWAVEIDNCRGKGVGNVSWKKPKVGPQEKK
jgi:hypothetical protein